MKKNMIEKRDHIKSGQLDSSEEISHRQSQWILDTNNMVAQKKSLTHQSSCGSREENGEQEHGKKENIYGERKKKVRQRMNFCIFLVWEKKIKRKKNRVYLFTCLVE